jgi:putative ABC transport system permease protein
LSSTLISILGLSAGVLCFIYIHLFIQYEQNYDRFHDHSLDIYRIVRQSRNNSGQNENTTTTSFAVAETLKQNLTEVKSSTAVYRSLPVLLKANLNAFYEDKLIATDSNFFRVFTFPLLDGSVSGALKSRESIVLTQSTARKYFGAENPIGQAMDIEGRGRVYVTAIAKDVPTNSHIQFNALILRQPFEEWEIDNWGPMYCITYAKLHSNSNPEVFLANIRALAVKHKPNSDDVYDIQPLGNIHLDIPKRGELEAGGDRTTLKILTLISYFILVVASVNYINMATAQSSKRSKEVAIRKTSGARREQLIVQFLTESMLVVLISSLVGVGVCFVFEDVFTNFTGKEIPVIQIVQGSFPIFLGIVCSLIGLLSGLYPALFLSSLNPIIAIKAQHLKQSGLLRKGLVGLQFTVSIGLIISTIVVTKQVNYINEKKLGFEKEQVIVLPNLLNVAGRDVLEQKLNELAGVTKVGAATSSLDRAYWTSNVRTDISDQYKTLNFCQVNYEYIDALGIKLKAGRNFSRAMPVDTFNTVILNQAAVESFGLKDPIGQKLIWESNETIIFTEVIGVVEDFHYLSLHEPIKPYALLVRNSFFVQHDFTSKLFVRINTTNYQDILKAIESTWTEVIPDKPFTYYFLDDSFDALHKDDIYLKKIFSLLTAITIVISCFGLLALTAFILDQRTKEFGIRKILGANQIDIFSLLMNEFIWIMVPSLIIASPIAWYLMNNWLDSYAYRIVISISVFFLTGVICSFIVVLVTSYHTYIALHVSPANSLRRE